MEGAQAARVGDAMASVRSDGVDELLGRHHGTTVGSACGEQREDVERPYRLREDGRLAGERERYVQWELRSDGTAVGPEDRE